MATMREKRPGVWEVRAFTGRDERGRPTQVSRTVHGTKKDAQRVAAEMTLRPSKSARRTVGDLIDLWLEQNEAVWAPSTLRDQVSRAALVKADPIAKVSVARLTVAEVDSWHARLRRAGAGEGSIRNQHQALRAALTQAMRWGWVMTNVATVAGLGRRKTAPRGSLTPDQVRRVLAEAAAHDPAAGLALRIAAVTGARRAELAALQWSDLDGNRLTIDSSLAIIRHGRKGDRQTPTLRDDPTKTANRRTVTLDPGTVDAIEALRAERSAYGPWILAVGDRPVNPERITSWWRLAAGRAGLEPRWRLHDLRHWSATLAIGSGHDLRTVANRLGHANPAMTLRVYAHALDIGDQAVAETLGAALDDGDG
jgi:integrase